jgi:hypothetical protein
VYVIPKIRFGNYYCINQFESPCEEMCVSEFDPVVIKSVSHYLLSHPEINFSTDIIKERYSKTREESYLSFGCPECDAIFGNHYVTNLRLDSYYEDDEKLHDVYLADNGVKFDYLHWTIRE